MSAGDVVGRARIVINPELSDQFTSSTVAEASRLGDDIEAGLRRTLEPLGDLGDRLADDFGGGLRDGIEAELGRIDVDGAARDIAGGFERAGEQIEDSFDEAAREADQAFEKMEREADESGDKIGRSFGKLAALAGGIFAGVQVAQGLKNATLAAEASNSAIAELQATIDATGGAAGLTTDQIVGFTDALSVQIGVADEELQNAASTLLTFRNVGADVFEETIGLAADLSANLGQDLAGGTLQLGKALNDPIAGISALTRVGVTFSEQQKEQIKTLQEGGDIVGAQRVILNELENQVGGVAEATADSSAKLGVLFGNLQETLGGPLTEILDALFPSIQIVADELAPVLAELGEAIGPVLADTFRALAPAVGPVASAITALIGAVGPLIPTLAELFAGVVEVGAVLLEIAAEPLRILVDVLRTDVVPVLLDGLLSVLDAIRPVLPDLSAALGSIATAFGEILVALTPLIGPLTDLMAVIIRDVGVPVLVALAEILAELAQALLPLLTAAVGILMPVLEAFTVLIRDVGGFIVDFIIGPIKAAIGFITDLIGLLPFVDGPGKNVGPSGRDFAAAGSSDFAALRLGDTGPRTTQTDVRFEPGSVVVSGSATVEDGRRVGEGIADVLERRRADLAVQGVA